MPTGSLHLWNLCDRLCAMKYYQEIGKDDKETKSDKLI